MLWDMGARTNLVLAFEHRHVHKLWDSRTNSLNKDLSASPIARCSPRPPSGSRPTSCPVGRIAKWEASNPLLAEVLEAHRGIDAGATSKACYLSSRQAVASAAEGDRYAADTPHGDEAIIARVRLTKHGCLPCRVQEHRSQPALSVYLPRILR